MSDPSLNPIYFRPFQVRELFGMSRQKLYRLINEGHIKAVKPGRMTLIRFKDMERYLERLGD